MAPRRPRSANVTPSVDSTGLVIHRSDMDSLLKEDSQLESKVLRNLLGLLCDRLIDANLTLEDHAKTAQNGDDRVEMTVEEEATREWEDPESDV